MDRLRDEFTLVCGRVVMEDIEIDAADPIERCQRGREACGEEDHSEPNEPDKDTADSNEQD